MTNAERQIHGLRLIMSKTAVAQAIERARVAGGRSPFTALRDRTPAQYAALLDALERSR